MIGEGKYPEDICEDLLGYCLAPVCQMGGLGGDNMSIIIICMLHGKPWEQLVEKCKKMHADKKASKKLSEPAFSQFDRFTADGPFAEVSVLKEVHNTTDSTSSSSHTSSSSSSPISADEKFDALNEGNDAEKASKSEEVKVESPPEVQSDDIPKVQIDPVAETSENVVSITSQTEDANIADVPTPEAATLHNGD